MAICAPNEELSDGAHSSHDTCYLFLTIELIVSSQSTL